jgi:hypothetical protein
MDQPRPKRTRRAAPALLKQSNADLSVNDVAQVLLRTGGNVNHSARLLGVERALLHSRIEASPTLKKARADGRQISADAAMETVSRMATELQDRWALSIVLAAGTKEEERQAEADKLRQETQSYTAPTINIFPVITAGFLIGNEVVSHQEAEAAWRAKQLSPEALGPEDIEVVEFSDQDMQNIVRLTRDPGK